MSSELPDVKFESTVDAVVREMLDVEPPADLRARVIARIDHERAPAGFRWLRVAAPLAVVALAAIVLAVWLPRRPPLTPTRETHTAARVENLPVAQAVQPHATATAPVRTTVQERTVRAASLVPRVGTGPTDDGDTAAAIAPLKPIAPIRVAAVRPSDITPQPISIEPLAPVAQLQIAPLTPPDGRH
ncbi:MAG: hypothetical protein ACRD1V_01110 [Vicinamibacterales bacterium]